MDLILNKVICDDWQNRIHEVLDKSIDLVLTDPPYGINYISQRRKKKHLVIENDNNLDWLNKWLKELKRVCKDNAHIYIFCSWHNVDIFKQQISHFFNIKNILIFEKNVHGAGDLEGDYAPIYELIIFCSNGRKKLNGKRIPNIIKSAKVKTSDHPTEKPTALLKLLIEKSTNKGDIVLDTFAGTFSTAIACKELCRQFICFEIDPLYCKLAHNKLKGLSQSLF